jgi:hypothetical protein
MSNVKVSFGTKRQASEYVGGLSNPAKMPCKSYGLPASECIVGSKLRAIPGSVCSKCYAHKGCYAWNSTQVAQRRRFDVTMGHDWERWEAAFVKLMENAQYFRWHDSGDVQGLDHLEAIDRIAQKCPDTRFWLPTKEYGTVRAFLRKHGAFAPNLNVRVSAPMLGEMPKMIEGTTGSAVNVSEAFQCRAPQQDGECRDCRACWDASVPVVSYKQH